MEVRFAWRSFISTDLWFAWLPLAGALFMSIPLWFPEAASSEGKLPPDEFYVWCYSIAVLMNLLGWVNRRQVVEIRADTVRLSRGLIPNIWGYQRISIPRDNIIAVDTGRQLDGGGGPDEVFDVDVPEHLQTCRLLIQDRPDHYYRFVGELNRHQWNPIMHELCPPKAPQDSDEPRSRWSNAFAAASGTSSEGLRSLDETNFGNRLVGTIAAFIVIFILLLVFKSDDEPEAPNASDPVEETTQHRDHESAKARTEITQGCGLAEPNSPLLKALANVDVSPAEWREYTCEARQNRSAREWRKCLRWNRYTTDKKKACPGKQRCCPPSL